MKKIILATVVTLLSVIAYSQEHPCPNVQSHTLINISQCTAKVQIYASSSSSSQKGLRVQVYANGILIKDQCFIVAGNSNSTLYQTDIFAYQCASNITYIITRYTSSNGQCQGGTCSVIILPISISSFNVKRKNNIVILNWATASEVNAKNFVIERNDGNGFISVGTVAALNNVAGNLYTYTDINNLKKVSQYRLKLIDMDASYKYSEIRAVTGLASVSDFTVFPNPSTGAAKVIVADISEASKVDVLDITGRVIKTFELQNNNSVEVKNLQSGIYLVRIFNKENGYSITKKLIVNN